MAKSKSSRQIEGEDMDRDDVSEDDAAEARPIGQPFKKSGRGKGLIRFYKEFELDGMQYKIEDTVLVTPETKSQKPYVAMIKEIKQAVDGSLMVLGQWFYRPEEAEKPLGGFHSSVDARELFYSFHRDEVPAESVMHKCVVHFIAPNKQLPVQSKHPGHVVRRVYDAADKRLWKLTDKDYEDGKQREIEQLMEQTRQLIGDLPEIPKGEPEQPKEDPAMKAKKRRNLAALRTERQEAAKEASGKEPVKEAEKGGAKSETPKTPQQSEIYNILQKNGVLVDNNLANSQARNRWLEKLLQGVKYVCDVDKKATEEVEHRLEGAGEKAEQKDNSKVEGAASGLTDKVEAEDQAVGSKALEAEISTAATEVKGNKAGEAEPTIAQVCSTNAEVTERSDSEAPQEQSSNVSGLVWPDTAVEAVAALERCAHDLGLDVHKYNLKMRSLEFNLRNSAILARRLLSKELLPAAVVHMSPTELKEGLTAAEQSAKEPPQPKAMQMTDKLCPICNEREVGVRDVIQVGHGDRYQLECMKCGHSWYTSRDNISSLTLEIRSPTVGTAPWATSKFEDVPHQGELSPVKDAADVIESAHLATETTAVEDLRAGGPG